MYIQTVLAALEGWSRLSIAVGTIFALFLGSFIHRTIYNVYFHPLSKFPGPWYRAAFSATNVWSMFHGRSLTDTKELHDRYGSVVRIAPDALSYNDFQAWKDIYGYGPNRSQIAKDQKRFPDVDMASNIINSEDSDHARIRKHLGHAFSDLALREQEPLLNGYFDLLITRLKDQLTGNESTTVDMMRWYNFMTFDIISEMCLGEPFGTLNNGEYATYIHNLFAGLKFYRWIYAAQEYQWVKALLAVLMRLPAFKEQAGTHFFYTESRTLKRIEQGQTDRKDFITYILQHDDQKGMTTREITETSAILMTAGAETAATSLAGATYQLLRNPVIYNKAKDEVRSAFSSQDQMRTNTVGQLTYLNAIIEETLRIYPPAAGNFQRRTGAQGAVICGEYVAPDTSVGVHQWSTHHSATNFHDPDSFIPERWLPNKPAEFANDKISSMQPFSYGPRNCVGRSLAYFEIRSVLCRMLFNFDLELLPQSQGWAERQQFHILWEKGPLEVRLRERKA